MSAAMEAMRVLTSAADTGAVTLALPQDVQAEAWDFPEAFLRERVWVVPRPLPDERLLAEAAELIRGSRRPIIAAGGGVAYSDATTQLRAFVDAAGIPVGETQAGKGSLPFDHPSSLGAIGVTGTAGANLVARGADLVIGLGTRYSDFTTASKTAFRDPEVRFVNVNVAPIDAHKHAGIALVGDVRATLDALLERLQGFRVDPAYTDKVAGLNREWDREVDRVYNLGQATSETGRGHRSGERSRRDRRGGRVRRRESPGGPAQALAGPRSQGLSPLEYGYSCMGYEIPGGLGAKLACPERDVFVMVGDGSWLMMSSEIATCVQEGIDLTVVLVDNHGVASIGGLSESVGSGGFGTSYRYRGGDGQLSGEVLPVDLVANAASLGAHAVRASSVADLRQLLREAKQPAGTWVIVVETDPAERVGSYETWWDVPVAEVSTMEPVRSARQGYERASRDRRWYL